MIGRPWAVQQHTGGHAGMSNGHTYEYKVVSFRESLIGDALDSDKLEKILNKHAEDGLGLRTPNKVTG
ncbi:conserved hypothetical protein [Streptomyces sviceus ATCC 29083]|uniref:Uncharacterized protein n=2 Tax=Streptomyces TaxID=1883 RepID=B5I6K5_STRX2|nr:conserved hypothetical protein [Streptomyces sviceus ATCC 29083]